MEKITDWKKLWKELVEMHALSHKDDRKKRQGDRWQDRARLFHDKVKDRWMRPDPHRDFIIERLRAGGGETVLDIGAGTGAWAILMARFVRKVTALEPSQEMREVMKENLEMEGVSNVEIIEGSWPDSPVPPHDFSLCSHAMYGCPDLPVFVNAMVKATRNTCFLLFRAPAQDGVMAQAAMRIWGQPNDSPNFQVAYGVMLQMGLHPNVLMEAPGNWGPWTSPSIREALSEMRRRFVLGQSTEYDAFLLDLLNTRLKFEEGRYVWPVDLRTALVYWDV